MSTIIDREGFLIVKIGGLEISPQEQDLLAHQAIAGVILYSHNYTNKSQLKELIEALHNIKPGFIVSVDQECQKVQRFKEGFTQLPSPIEIGRYYEKDEEAALKLAYAYGVVIGSEMREINIDLSYTPVLDMAHFGGVIGDRAFHSDAKVVTALAREMITGLHNSSLAACGKHFPGHGSVSGDTHTDEIHDTRPIAEIEAHDLYPFTTLIEGSYLDAVMLSHIIYDAVSDSPASLSEYWIKTVLREQLSFSGLICSDDLDMVGSGNVDAAVIKRTMDMGCDLLLLCRRNLEQLRQLLDAFSDTDIRHYSRLNLQHVGAIDSHMFNRIPPGTKHYSTAVAKIKDFNSRSSNNT